MQECWVGVCVVEEYWVVGECLSEKVEFRLSAFEGLAMGSSGERARTKFCELGEART